MGGTGIIDQFLETFTRYIDSGFGLLGGECPCSDTADVVHAVQLRYCYTICSAITNPVYPVFRIKLSLISISLAPSQHEPCARRQL